MDESKFNPNDVGAKGTLFGLPNHPNPKLIILPVPWEVTVSYRASTAQGPAHILECSDQLDYCIHGIQEPWKLPLHFENINSDWAQENSKLRAIAAQYIHALEQNEPINEQLLQQVKEINLACKKLHDSINQKIKKWLGQGKLVAVLGGDHSCALGSIQAHDDQPIGILQIDAHADLRDAYEGFTYSHASIMHQAIKLDHVQKLVQVGIRDYCPEELALINSSHKVHTFFDAALNEEQFNGATWHQQCLNIINLLPENVYISFDIDGLEPALCPDTGTPVPGGLTYNQAMYLIKLVALSGRKIVGFDLCEVATGPNNYELNAIIGARVLYQLSCWSAVSQGILTYCNK